MSAGENPELFSNKNTFKQHVANLQEFPIETLSQTFEIDDLINLYEYQESITAEELAKHPFPEHFVSKYNESTALLSYNTSLYDDSLDDQIGYDQVIVNIAQSIKKASRKEPLYNALRARRSTIVAILFSMNQPECAVIQMPELNEQQNQTSPESNISNMG